MTTHPDPGGNDSTAVLDLCAAVARAKGGDAMAPVTVVTPSGYAAVYAQRALARQRITGDGRGCANVEFTTIDRLIRSLGVAVLGGRGLRLAPSAVDLEAMRAEASASTGWPKRLSGHPGAMAALQRTFNDLRACPPETIDALARRPGRTGELIVLFRAVRRHLHDRDFADTLDLVEAAAEVARREAGDGARTTGLGPVLCWQLGHVPPLQAAVLRALGAVVAGGGDRGSVSGASVSSVALTEVCPCTDPEEEARLAVRTVIEAAEAGVAFWRQAIFHPAGATYSRVLHQQLAAAGVASAGPGARRLDRTMTGRAVADLLALAGSEWPRDQFVAWLSSAPLTAGVGGRPVPASRWDALSADAGVVKGPGQWRERLAYLATTSAHGDEVHALLAFVEDILVRTTAPGPTWEAHAGWAIGLLDHYLSPAVDAAWPAEELAGAEQVRGVIGALAELDKVSAGTDLASFRRAVRSQLEGAQLDAHDLSGGGFGDGVFVAPFAFARGLHFDAVVLTGLTDSAVPGAVAEDTLLLDAARHFDASGALPLRAERIDTLRAELTTALEAGARQRVATLPRSDPRTGRAQVPCRWLEAMADGATVRRSVDSFSAGVRQARSTLSAPEFRLQELRRWADAGRDPVEAPAARHPTRLSVGLFAARCRANTSFTRFDGLVGTGLVAALDPLRPVSATRFETFAKCPRRYLFERVLNVGKRSLPEELWKIEPSRRGSLVHSILEKFVVERMTGTPRSLERLLEIADEHFAEAEGTGIVGKPLLWRIERAGLGRDLRRFYLEEGTMEPLAAELNFGGDGNSDPAVSVVLDDGRAVHFRGQVDRVERSPTGQLVVSDYKTGRQTGLAELTKDPVAAGTLLQLPLYGLAARARFGGSGPVHARYWLLSSERSAPGYTVTVTEDVEKRFRHVIGLIAAGVETGLFPAVPGAPRFWGSFDNCSFCDFDTLCPASRDRQWGRKCGSPTLSPVTDLLADPVPEELAGAVVRRLVDPDVDGPR